MPVRRELLTPLTSTALSLNVEACCITVDVAPSTLTMMPIEMSISESEYPACRSLPLRLWFLMSRTTRRS
jgi:hypothetical protein